MVIFSVLLIVLLVLWLYFSLRSAQRGHEDPADETFVDFEQLPSLCRLGPGGRYVVLTLRQSGNEHQDRRVFDNAAGAINAGVATLKRSGVPYVRITYNTSERFEFGRPFHDHRGRAEGKKVGWIEIVRLT